MSHKKKKRKIKILNLILFILLVVLVVILVWWATKNSLQNDRTAIGAKNFSELELTASSQPETPAENIDVDALTENFTYATLNQSQISEGLLGIYDSENPFVGETNLKNIYNYLFDDEGLQIASAKSADIKGDSETLSALNEMLKAFYSETGLRTIMINQVYAEADDSTAEPEYTEGYYDYYGNYVEPQLIEPETEPADCYEHDSGYAVDLGLYIRETDSLRDFDGSGDYEWFAENSWRYGFVLRYPSDKEELTGTAYNAAHFRYVGKAAAKVMNEQNMCLEEFADFIKDYNYDNPLTVETSSGSQVLYYIGSSGLEETSVQIPADLEGNPCIYSVSGNNSDGFVITLTPTEEFIAASGIETTSSEDLSDSTDSADSAENQ